MPVTTYESVTVGGGDFQIPDVESGTYEATIIAVDEGEFPSFEDHDVLETKLMVDWALDGMFEVDADGNMTDKPISLRQFVRIPPGLAKGNLHEKATLYKVLQALRLLPDAGQPFRVAPDEWVGGQALVLVNRVADVNGNLRPRIQGVNPPLRKAAASENGFKPTEAQQALLSALQDKYGGLVGSKMTFLEENHCEGETVTAMVGSLPEQKARALTTKLKQKGDS